jgi:hypothetical protein
MNNDNTTKREISECFLLSNQVAYKQFEFNNADFNLEIISATLVVESTLNWAQLLPQFELWVHLIGNSTDVNVAIPTVQYSTPLNLIIDPYTKKPIFQFNKLIDKQVFGSNINLSGVNSFIVKIEHIEKVTINDKYSLQLKIIKQTSNTLRPALLCLYPK